MEKKLKVKIERAEALTSWYADKIGEEFEVTNDPSSLFYEMERSVKGNIYILKSDCSILSDTPAESVELPRVGEVWECLNENGWLASFLKGKLYKCVLDGHLISERGDSRNVTEFIKDFRRIEPVAPVVGGEEQPQYNNYVYTEPPVNEWQKALVSLTPGGSEFVDDWERCVEYVKCDMSQLEEIYNEGKQAYEALEMENKQLKAQQPAIDESRAISFGKHCFYKGYAQAKISDANCFEAWREESGILISDHLAPPTHTITIDNQPHTITAEKLEAINRIIK